MKSAGDVIKIIPTDKSRGLITETPPLLYFRGGKNMAEITMFNEIRDIILKYSENGEKEISYDTDIIDELGLDSFGFISMLGDVEEKFSFSIADNELEEAFRLFTPDDLIHFVMKKVS